MSYRAIARELGIGTSAVGKYVRCGAMGMEVAERGGRSGPTAATEERRRAKAADREHRKAKREELRLKRNLSLERMAKIEQKRDQVLELRRQGLSCAKVGAMLGLTRQRVHQIERATGAHVAAEHKAERESQAADLRERSRSMDKADMCDTTGERASWQEAKAQSKARKAESTLDALVQGLAAGAAIGAAVWAEIALLQGAMV